MSLRSLVLISAFIIAVAVVAMPFYSVRSSSLPKGGLLQPSAPSRANENVNRVGSLRFGISAINGLMAPAAMFDDESIAVSPPAVRAPGCTNPAVMCLGETVSAQVVNAPLRPDFRERRIQWIAPDGTVPHMWTVDESPENDTYTLETTGTFAQVGTWTVRTINNRGGGVAVATFEVGDPTQPSVDLALSMTGPATVGANQAATYEVTLTNTGPDAAANVVLVNPVPANSTFASATPGSGFSCTTPGAGQNGEIECTAASLAVGAPVVFSFTFTTSSDVGGGTTVFNAAQVETSTNEPIVANNVAYVASNSPESTEGEGPCTLTCRDDVVVTADTTQSGNAGRFVSYSAASGSGNCGSISNSPGSGSFFSVSGSPHTITSSSSEGPSCTFTVTVLDSAPPTISCPANITVTAESGEDHATLPSGPGAPTYTASGGDETVVGVRSDGTPATYDDEGNVLTPAVVVPLADPYPLGTTGILWTVTDAAGRTASCTQSITVQAVPRDTLTIACPANITTTAPSGSCENATVTVGEPTTHPSDSHVTFVGVRSDGQALTDPYPAGVTQITWTATDDTNDSVASCTQSVTVTGTDNVAPTLVIPANVSVTTNSCSATLDDELGVATAEDNCAPSVNIVRTGVPANFVFPTGTTVITYTATDASGNTAVGTQLVTVHENTPPSIVAPANVTAYTGPGATSCGAVVGDATLGTASANDNCPGVTVTRTGVPAGNNFPVGPNVVTYTATDASGNTAVATQQVTVIDNTPPTISCVADIVADFDPAVNGAVVTFTAPVGADNCPGAATAQIGGLASGSTFPLGTTTNTFRVTDSVGQTAECSFKVTVALTSIIGLNSVSITGASYADSYSSAGGYPATKGSLANIVSNGTITMGNSGKVWGNVRSTQAGVNMTGASQVTGNATAGTTVSTSGSATIGGTRTNNAPVPAITLPSVPACGPYSSNSGISGTYSYNASTGNLTLSGVNIATLANGTYCFNNVTLGNSAQLKVNGPVVIRLTGTLNTSGATKLNNTTLIPSNLQILSSYSGSNGVILGNSASIYALVYAPNTGVNISGSAPLFGTAAGKTITMGNSGAIHYDTQLKTIWPGVWTLIFGP